MFNKEANLRLPSARDVDQYKLFRRVGAELYSELIGQLPKSAIQECAKKLGILKYNTLVLDSEDELSVLFDYCIYYFRINQANVVSRYLSMSPPPVGSVEMTVIQSMLKAYYSIFIVENVFEYKGVSVLDVLHNNEIFVIDMGMAKSSIPGIIFAGNLIPMDGFYRTSGAVLPIPKALFKDIISPIVRKFFRKDDDVLSSGQEAAFAAQVIRTALRAGVMENVKYQDA